MDTERRLVRLSEDTADLLSRQARSKGQAVSAAEVDQAKADLKDLADKTLGKVAEGIEAAKSKLD